ncbi:MAG: zinc-binding dehydrogenase [Fulvivirga sp.]
MKALTLTAPGKVEIVSIDKPKIDKGQVLVKIKSAALNKRDQFIREGKYPNIQLNCALGSDGAGVVEALGDGVSKSWKGKSVVINPNQQWGNGEVQSRDYSILGMPDHGTFAEYVVVNVDRLVDKPEHLTFEEAAAMPLGGVTAYRACFHHGNIKKGENVLISGFGGGVAQFAFQFAKAVDANVYVTSGDQSKMDQAVQLGASAAYNYKEKDWFKKVWQTKGGFDVVIDSAGGDQVNDFIKIMKPGGRIVFYGATNGLPTTLDLYRMFWNQIKLQGSTMGSDKEFQQMIKFVEKHKIKPIIAGVKPFEKIVSAFDELASNKKTGKIIVNL